MAITIRRFVAWWNHIRPHMSLDWDNLEMPVGAFIRKIPPKGATVIYEQSGEVYDVTWGRTNFGIAQIQFLDKVDIW